MTESLKQLRNYVIDVVTPHYLNTENTRAIFPTALILFLMTSFLWDMLESSTDPGRTFLSSSTDRSSAPPFRVSTFTNISVTAEEYKKISHPLLEQNISHIKKGCSGPKSSKNPHNIYILLRNQTFLVT